MNSKKIVINMEIYNKGITLIALVITIVVLLILAGVSIATLTGENGLLKNASDAKMKTEIADEKEVIELATIEAIEKDRYGNITEENLQNSIDKIEGEGKVQVANIGENFEIYFLESKRYYEVDNDGNVGDYKIAIEDKNPGDITTDKDGNILDGSEEHPYEIWCIEDLIEWSQNYAKYKSLYIKLCKTLNFNSNLSYTNGKMLNCNSIKELKELLTQISGSGFTPIANFEGNFDGQNFEIQNIYINSVSNYAGLFFQASGIIQNLGITGNIVSLGDAGGIVGGSGSSALILKNCYNLADVTANKNAGGIIGSKYSGNTIVKCLNCYNSGKIEGNSSGGIFGYTSPKRRSLHI